MSVIDFYDRLSPFYHLIYPDWDASIRRQAAQLQFVICELWDDNLVIACDNAVPHLLSDDEIRGAFREMHRCIGADGGCLISVRDYDPAESGGTKVVPYGVRSDGDRRFLVFQVWEYQGPIYDLSMYFVEDRGGFECTTHVMRSK